MYLNLIIYCNFATLVQVGSKFIKYKSFHYTISPAIFMSIQFIWVIIGKRLMVNWSGMILNWNLGRGKIFGKVLEDQSRLSVNVSHGHWFTELILHPDCQISNWSNLKIRWVWAKDKILDTLWRHQDQAHLLCSLMKNYSSDPLVQIWKWDQIFGCGLLILNPDL